MKIDIELANKCVILHALLEQAQSLLDDLEGTNMYSHKLKSSAKMFASELQKKVATWYSYNLQNESTQILYLQVCKDLDEATNALLQARPESYKVVPAFIEALESGELQILKS